MSGSEMLSGRLESGEICHTVRTGTLAHGMYLVKIQAGNHKLVRKVVL
jgi:hypothetical protein